MKYCIHCANYLREVRACTSFPYVSFVDGQRFYHTAEVARALDSMCGQAGTRWQAPAVANGEEPF